MVGFRSEQDFDDTDVAADVKNDDNNIIVNIAVNDPFNYHKCSSLTLS